MQNRLFACASFNTSAADKHQIELFGNNFWINFLNTNMGKPKSKSKSKLTSALMWVSTSSGDANWQTWVFCFNITETKPKQRVQSTFHRQTHFLTEFSLRGHRAPPSIIPSTSPQSLTLDLRPLRVRGGLGTRHDMTTDDNLCRSGLGRRSRSCRVFYYSCRSLFTAGVFWGSIRARVVYYLRRSSISSVVQIVKDLSDLVLLF